MLFNHLQVPVSENVEGAASDNSADANTNTLSVLVIGAEGGVGSNPNINNIT